jgi:lambda repressor-like predicted transcriptional regulator
MLPHPQGWHPEDIKAALRKSGWTQQRVADELDLCRHTVSATIWNGQSQRVGRSATRGGHLDPFVPFGIA